MISWNKTSDRLPDRSDYCLCKIVEHTVDGTTINYYDVYIPKFVNEDTLVKYKWYSEESDCYYDLNLVTYWAYVKSLED